MCPAPQNGQINCGTGSESNNCSFSCNPGYILMEIACERNGNLSKGILPTCLAINCVNITQDVIPSQSCRSLQYQSQWNVSHHEPINGYGVSYLCNITNNFIIINSSELDGTCRKGLLFS